MQHECISVVKWSDLETMALQTCEKHSKQKEQQCTCGFLHCCEKESSPGLTELCLLHLSWWGQDLATELGKQKEVFLLSVVVVGEERKGVDVLKHGHRSWDTEHMTQSFCFLETTLLNVNWPPQGYQVFPTCENTCLSFNIFACLGNKY